MSTSTSTGPSAPTDGRAPRLVLAGNVIVDVVMRVPHLPERGGDVLASEHGLTAGGGFNVLTAARRLGLTALYGGAHGTGPFGDRIRAALDAEGIALALPVRPDADSGFCVALVDGEGERTFVTALGAEADVTGDDTAALARELRPGDLVQLSGYGLAHPGSGPALAAFVRDLPAGVKLSLDPGPLVGEIPAGLLEPVLARCDWLSCNLREARLMTEDAGAPDGAAVAAALLTRTGGGVVVRGDASGCWVAEPGRGPGHGPVHVPGRPVRAVDSNGAGDAHVGAFLTLLARGAEPREAARGANVAASLAVTRHGPATGPTHEELLAVLGADDPLRGLPWPR